MACGPTSITLVFTVRVFECERGRAECRTAEYPSVVPTLYGRPVVRRMLDRLLLDGEGGSGLSGASAAEALEGFLEEADRLAESHSFPEGYRFDREDLYEDRV